MMKIIFQKVFHNQYLNNIFQYSLFNWTDFKNVKVDDAEFQKNK